MKKAESRAATGTVSLIGNKIAGQWLVFNEPSQLMLGERDGKKVLFREVISPSVFDEDILTDVKCCADHREVDKFLGRTPGSLRITITDTGSNYECDLLDTSTANEVRQHIERGDYAGNSFRFYVKEDRWKPQPNGHFLRTVSKMHAIEHIGPVKDPAYLNTDVKVAMRSLENSGVLAQIEEEGKEDSNKQKLKFKHEHRARELALRSKETGFE